MCKLVILYDDGRIVDFDVASVELGNKIISDIANSKIGGLSICLIEDTTGSVLIVLDHIRYAAFKYIKTEANTNE